MTSRNPQLISTSSKATGVARNGATVVENRTSTGPAADRHAAHILSIRRSTEFGRSEPVEAGAEMFQETAHTVLPIEHRGHEVILQAHAYEDDTASYQALALVHRDAKATNLTPVVRLHSGCVTGDIFHSLRCDCYQQLQMALDAVIESPYGIIIYLPHHEGRGIGLVNKIKAYAEQDRGLDTVDANLSIGAPVDARDYELSAKILKDMDCAEVRLLTNNPLKVEALEKHGIRVAEQIAHVSEPSRHNAKYLATKRERMSHKL